MTEVAYQNGWPVPAGWKLVAVEPTYEMECEVGGVRIDEDSCLDEYASHEKVREICCAVVKYSPPPPKAPDYNPGPLEVSVIGMPEFDALIDHIYEEGTSGGSVIQLANKLVRAAIQSHLRHARNSQPVAYKWGGVLIPAEESHPVHRKEGQPLYAAPVAAQTSGQAPSANADAIEAAMSAVLAESGAGVYYMNPPDGGGVLASEQVRRMAEDAARYRWLRERMLGIDFDWADAGITALSFEMPDGMAYGGDCDRNIDAAMSDSAGLIAAAPFLIGAPPPPVAGGYRGVSWRANGDANSYHLLRGGRWLAHILMNGELFVSQQTDMLERIVIALGGAAEQSGAAETALRQVAAVIQRYQAPAGISKYDAISEIIGIVQSVPLLDDATAEAQTHEPNASLNQP